MLQRLLLGLAALAAVFAAVLGVGSHFFTDWLWFQDLGYIQMLRNRLLWEWGVWLGSFVLVAGFVFANLLATRSAIATALWRYQEQLPFIKARHITFVMAGLSILPALMFASVFRSRFWDVSLFFHRVSFDRIDPILGHDVSYYVFTLPVLRIISAAAMGLLLITAVGCGFIYFGAGGVRMNQGQPVLSRAATRHLALLAAGFIVIRALAYRLDMAALLFSPGGTVYGVGFTDAVIRIPTLWLLMFLALASAAALILQIWRPSYRLVVGSVGLWFLASLLLGGIVPSLVQNWIVEPNEYQREKPYIDHHIAMTRHAWNLNGFETQPFGGQTALSADVFERYSGTIDNIRLWDPRAVLQTYRQLQEMRLYYSFTDVDIARYSIGDEYRQVLLAGREIAIHQLPNRTWINEHLQYTHGFGLVMSPVNEVTRQGMPEYWISDIPPRSSVDISVEQPRIYFGELTNQYVIVNAQTDEFDYPMGDTNAYYQYQGDTGVTLRTLLHRAAFALRFGTLRIVMSGELTSDSRVLFERNILDRVRKLAPFLRYDQDPYLIVAEDGRLYWIIDAYTRTASFPYAAAVRGWGNYARNSVKVVVDAYHGHVDFYQVESDPLLETYASVFPGFIQPLEAMPEHLQAHLRYPEDMLTVQGRVFGTYHMTDSRQFYNREDQWQFATETQLGREQEIEAYYTVLQLPGYEQPELVLMLPFTPVRRNNMVAWMAARNDPPHYGDMLVYTFPRDTTTLGPAQIEARIEQDSEISQLLTLWGQRGSRVVRGNMLVLPIGDSLLYVEPVYLESEQTGMPQLQRVIVADQENLIMSETLEQGIELLLEASEGRLDRSAVGLTEEEMQALDEETPAAPSVLREEDIAALSTEAYELYQEAAAKLRQGDFAGFGRAWDALEDMLYQLRGVEE